MAAPNPSAISRMLNELNSNGEIRVGVAFNSDRGVEVDRQLKVPVGVCVQAGFLPFGTAEFSAPAVHAGHAPGNEAASNLLASTQAVLGVGTAGRIVQLNAGVLFDGAGAVVARPADILANRRFARPTDVNGGAVRGLQWVIHDHQRTHPDNTRIMPSLDNVRRIVTANWGDFLPNNARNLGLAMRVVTVLFNWLSVGPREAREWSFVPDPAANAEITDAVLTDICALVDGAAVCVIAAKVNWYQANHHFGGRDDEIRGFLRKALDIVAPLGRVAQGAGAAQRNQAREEMTNIYRGVHCASTEAVLTLLNHNRPFGGFAYLAQLGHPRPINVDRFVALRMDSAPSGTRRVSDAIAAESVVARAGLLVFLPTSHELPALHVANDTIIHSGPYLHQGVHVLTRNSRYAGERVVFDQNDVAFAAAIVDLVVAIKILYPRSTLSAAATFGSIDNDAASAGWVDVCTAVARNRGGALSPEQAAAIAQVATVGRGGWVAKLMEIMATGDPVQVNYFRAFAQARNLALSGAGGAVPALGDPGLPVAPANAAAIHAWVVANW